MKAIVVACNINFCDILKQTVQRVSEAYAFPLMVEKAVDPHRILQSTLVYDIYFIALWGNCGAGIALAEGLVDKGIESEIVLIGKDEENMRALLHVKPCAFVLRDALQEGVEQAFSVLQKRLCKPQMVSIEERNNQYNYIAFSVLYFESDGNYVKVCFGNKRVEMVRTTLVNVEETTKDRGFLRIHKSLVVNLQHVDRVTYDKIYLTTGERLALGRSYRENLKQLLQKKVEESKNT